MEGDISTIANLFKETKEEDSIVNRIGVNKFRNPVKNPPFYILVKIMYKISHCCLIDGGYGPSVMSKIIMEEFGLLETVLGISRISGNVFYWVFLKIGFIPSFF